MCKEVLANFPKYYKMIGEDKTYSMAQIEKLVSHGFITFSHRDNRTSYYERNLE